MSITLAPRFRKPARGGAADAAARAGDDGDFSGKARGPGNGSGVAWLLRLIREATGIEAQITTAVQAIKKGGRDSPDRPSLHG